MFITPLFGGAKNILTVTLSNRARNPQKGSLGYDTKLRQMVRLHFRRVGFYMWVKSILKNYLYSIGSGTTTHKNSKNYLKK